MNKTKLFRHAARAAQAQTPQAFVSVGDVEDGTCKLAAPCRTFK